MSLKLDFRALTTSNGFQKQLVKHVVPLLQFTFNILWSLSIKVWNWKYSYHLRSIASPFLTVWKGESGAVFMSFSLKAAPLSICVVVVKEKTLLVYSPCSSFLLKCGRCDTVSIVGSCDGLLFVIWIKASTK